MRPALRSGSFVFFIYLVASLACGGFGFGAAQSFEGFGAVFKDVQAIVDHGLDVFGDGADPVEPGLDVGHVGGAALLLLCEQSQGTGIGVVGFE